MRKTAWDRRKSWRNDAVSQLPHLTRVPSLTTAVRPKKIVVLPLNWKKIGISVGRSFFFFLKTGIISMATYIDLALGPYFNDFT